MWGRGMNAHSDSITAPVLSTPLNSPLVAVVNVTEGSATDSFQMSDAPRSNSSTVNPFVDLTRTPNSNNQVGRSGPKLLCSESNPEYETRTAESFICENVALADASSTGTVCPY